MSHIQQGLKGWDWPVEPHESSQALFAGLKRWPVKIFQLHNLCVLSKSSLYIYIYIYIYIYTDDDSGVSCLNVVVRSHLEASRWSSHTEELSHNETVSLWITIYTSSPTSWMEQSSGEIYQLSHMLKCNNSPQELSSSGSRFRILREIYVRNCITYAENDDRSRVSWPTDEKSAEFDSSLKHPAGLATLKSCDDNIKKPAKTVRHKEVLSINYLS